MDQPLFLDSNRVISNVACRLFLHPQNLLVPGLLLWLHSLEASILAAVVGIPSALFYLHVASRTRMCTEKRHAL